jgi:ADP-ribosylglycohydrolase
MRSLINKRKIDFEDITLEHVREYDRSLIGWGGTRTAIERLKLKTHNYTNSGNKATGNGVLMKLAPLAFYFSKNDFEYEEKIDIIVKVAKMTHDSPSAIVTAITMTLFYEELFRLTNFIN